MPDTPWGKHSPNSTAERRTYAGRVLYADDFVWWCEDARGDGADRAATKAAAERWAEDHENAVSGR